MDLVRTLLPTTLALAAGVLAGCGSETVSSPPTDPGSPRPTAVPAADGEVGTVGAVTVLEGNDGPMLCLGGVAESMPPQCDGVPLSGWDWSGTEGWQRRGGVRWGDYVVSGRFDGDRLDVTSAQPEMLVNPGIPAEDEPGTPCEEPDGGWQVADPELTTPENLDATLQAASALEGFAAVWLDERGGGAQVNDPTRVVLNVAVTGDRAAAEESLRDTWGGMLCVSEAERSESELASLGKQVRAGDVPGLLAVSGRVDTLVVEVVHDDGSIQEWADRAFPEGVVQVESALRPVG